MRLFPENISKTKKINKALFLDRDGVINKDYGYVHKKDKFHFINGIFKLISFATKHDFIIIIVTNQAGIGRGIFSKNDFKNLSLWMIYTLKENNCRIDGIYFSPFHPVYGIGKYKKKENTRKPGPGLLNMASSDFNIDMNKSIIIGDKLSDIEAGYNSRVKERILIKNQKVQITQKQSFSYHKADNLDDAKKLIKSFIN